MTTKTASKEQEAPRADVGPTEDPLRTAYQVHTLAQMLYGHLATMRPWMTPMPLRPLEPMAGFQPMHAFRPVEPMAAYPPAFAFRSVEPMAAYPPAPGFVPPEPMVGFQPMHAHGRVEPMIGFQPTPWLHARPVGWSYPWAW